MSPALLPFVALAGGVGAIARYQVTRRIVLAASRPGDESRSGMRFLPAFGTAAVNLVGAFAAGLLLGTSPSGGLQMPAAVAAVGFVGAFTTFSAWMAEVVELWQGRRRVAALTHLLGTLAVGILLAALGLALTSPG
jgi:CrcB protein